MNKVNISSTISNIRKDPISEKIPKLALNTINDIRDISAFSVSPINSSRYDTKNSEKYKKLKSLTQMNSSRSMNLDKDLNDNKNKNKNKTNFDDEDEMNINIDLISREGITFNDVNYTDIKIEQLKYEFNLIFSSKNKLITKEAKKNKNKYFFL